MGYGFLLFISHQASVRRWNTSFIKVCKDRQIIMQSFSDESKNFQRQLNFPNQQTPKGLRFLLFVWFTCWWIREQALPALYSPELGCFHRSLFALPSVWGLEFVGDITQSNNGRTRLIQKTNRKQITWRHYIVFLGQYLPPTLLLLKGYRKFVSKIQPRC